MQVAASVILVRPTGFGYDPETAASNSFQHADQGPEIQRLAGEEFDELLDRLRQADIDFTVLDPMDRNAPNGVFPNNWFSTHADGTVTLYPMLTASRRTERDPDLASTLRTEGFIAERTKDLSGWEHRGLILEGTGSLVLDRTHKKAYACLSERTTEAAVKAWCEQFGYTPITFTATFDGRIQGAAVYHTNVVMSIGESFAVACFEAMPYPAERQELDEELRKSGKQVIPINVEQMHRFVGNMLELRVAHSNDRYIFLSETAFNALAPEQRIALQAKAQLIPVPIPTIETVGGGSVRCMLAENFLQRRP